MLKHRATTTSRINLGLPFIYGSAAHTQHTTHKTFYAVFCAAFNEVFSKSIYCHAMEMYIEGYTVFRHGLPCSKPYYYQVVIPSLSVLETT
jgi:hypothetical protein